MKRVLANKKAIALFVVPGFVLYTILVIVPVIWSLYYSLFSGSPGLQWEFVGFDNYVKLFHDKNFLNSLAVNAKYISVVMIGQVGLGLLLALMFRFWLKRCKTIVRTLVFFPVVLPTVAVGQLFAKIYEIQPNYGLLNSFLDAVGLSNLVQPWIGQESTARGHYASWISGLQWDFTLLFSTERFWIFRKIFWKQRESMELEVSRCSRAFYFRCFVQ